MTLKSLMNICCVALACQALAPTALAQTWPAKAVRIVVPYGTGGGADVLARQLGASLQQAWGHGVAVENRTGASGNIGSELVVNAPADGYTLLLQNSTMVVNMGLGVKLNYDPEKDLTPIMLLGVTPIALVAHPSLNVKNFKQLQDYAKANPGKLSYGSCGVGTPMHFVMELVKQKTALDAVHAGYKGCAPVVTDVVGGQIPLAIFSANLAAPYAKAGRLNVIGVASQKRYSLLPDALTLEEQGLKPLDFSTWFALMGPAKMPPAVVSKIVADVQKVLADPAVQSRLSNAGVEPYAGNGEALVKLIRSDKLRYEQLAKAANIKPE
ncbi:MULTISPECIES: tripartite tricarboxylate transporter substrate binding protein [unclassified Polaromonas]|uniref:Bug family tripartite tricarboxylate transporter substrate binding protein n=1 Tax=unclassified Polaromonas TaxID=2638319 RepID=UPI0013DE0FED|nr:MULTISPECIES: tripartite tricarboxylate transporter substrate binding protein [unclassified Polaromonas]